MKKKKDLENMQVYVKKNKRLRIVATSRPERNLLKHFKNKEVRIVGFGVETMGSKETKVELFLSFRTLAKPKEQKILTLKDHQEDSEK